MLACTNIPLRNGATVSLAKPYGSVICATTYTIRFSGSTVLSERTMRPTHSAPRPLSVTLGTWPSAASVLGLGKSRKPKSLAVNGKRTSATSVANSSPSGVAKATN